MKEILFSKLCLGARFRYPGDQRTFVKLSNDRNSGCVAEWNSNEITTAWVGQGVFALNDNGDDMTVNAILE